MSMTVVKNKTLFEKLITKTFLRRFYYDYLNNLLYR